MQPFLRMPNVILFLSQCNDGDHETGQRPQVHIRTGAGVAANSEWISHTAAILTQASSLQHFL